MSTKNKLKGDLILEMAESNDRIKQLKSYPEDSFWHEIIHSSEHILLTTQDLPNNNPVLKTRYLLVKSHRRQQIDSDEIPPLKTGRMPYLT